MWSITAIIIITLTGSGIPNSVQFIDTNKKKRCYFIYDPLSTYTNISIPEQETNYTLHSFVQFPVPNNTKYSTIAWSWVFWVDSCVWLHRGFLEPNLAAGSDAIFQGRILVTVPNAFLDSWFMNPVCTHAEFERSTDKEWHNPSRTSDKVAWILATQELSLNN